MAHEQSAPATESSGDRLNTNEMQVLAAVNQIQVLQTQISQPGVSVNRLRALESQLVAAERQLRIAESNLGIADSEPEPEPTGQYRTTFKPGNTVSRRHGLYAAHLSEALVEERRAFFEQS